MCLSKDMRQLRQTYDKGVIWVEYYFLEFRPTNLTAGLPESWRWAASPKDGPQKALDKFSETSATFNSRRLKGSGKGSGWCLSSPCLFLVPSKSYVCVDWSWDHHFPGSHSSSAHPFGAVPFLHVILHSGQPQPRCHKNSEKISSPTDCH